MRFRTPLACDSALEQHVAVAWWSRVARCTPPALPAGISWIAGSRWLPRCGGGQLTGFCGRCPTAAKGSYGFGHPLWFKIIWMKVDLLPELLRWGYHVIWSDVDVVSPSHLSVHHTQVSIAANSLDGAASNSRTCSRNNAAPHTPASQQ